MIRLNDTLVDDFGHKGIVIGIEDDVLFVDMDYGECEIVLLDDIFEI